jgi:purine-binding chemotaxis protein CheW
VRRPRLDKRTIQMTEKDNVMNEIQLVVFDLASEHYGVDISDVREIMRMQNITRVPGAMASVEGVLNLRGKVLPVLDLRKRLGLKATEYTENSRIVIIDIECGQAGVIVDAVTEVLRVQNSHIDPPSTMVAHGECEYLKGIAKFSDRLIILLDLNRLLSRQAMDEYLAATSAASTEETASEKVVSRQGNGAKTRPAGSNGKGNAKEYSVV